MNTFYVNTFPQTRGNVRYISNNKVGYSYPDLSKYRDKPMKGHNLMQAIARVKRVFRDK